ncbi:MAG: energy transducer TonB [Methylococcaceae bacterium]|nr:energy transducer TonB [Methylococcaceae bacterium]
MSVMRATWNNPDRLLIMLFLAGVFHALVILGVSFDRSKPEKIRKSLDIVLVRNPSAPAPEKADFLAQENQFGSGEAKEKAIPKVEPIPGETEVVQEQAPAAEPKPQPKLKPRSVLKQARAEKKTVADSGEEAHVEEESPKLSAEALSQQIAEFTTEYNRSLQNQAKGPRTVYINSVNAHKFKAAAYEKAWQDKVERIGNLNYPDEARRKGLTGSLVLAVGLKPDGSVYSLRITTSSGEPVLDDAAKRIVQLAAPFAPFPEELRQEADVLVITRSWSFSNDNRVVTGH